MSSHNYFKIEGVLSSMGSIVRPLTQPLMDRVLDNAEGIVGFCSDFGSEQRLIIPDNHFRFWDLYHTQSNIWQSLIDKDDAYFRFNGGRLLNARISNAILSRNHEELGAFSRMFRPINSLPSRMKCMTFFVLNDLASQLAQLCEEKILAENAHEGWEDMLRFSQLMISLGIIFKTGFMEIPMNERIALYSSTIIRVKQFNFKNKVASQAALYTKSLFTSIIYMRHHDHGPHTGVFFKSALTVLEGLKYQMKKAGIIQIGHVQRMYEILSQGAVILNLDSPYGFLNRVVCAPSEPIII